MPILRRANTGQHLLATVLQGYLNIGFNAQTSISHCPELYFLFPNIQKVLGCNKMTCTSCWMFFCWMCSSILNKSNPYGHFQDQNSPCYYRWVPPSNITLSCLIWFVLISCTTWLIILCIFILSPWLVFTFKLQIIFFI